MIQLKTILYAIIYIFFIIDQHAAKQYPSDYVGCGDKCSNRNIISKEDMNYSIDESCGCQDYDSPTEGGRIAYLITAHNRSTLRDALLLLKNIVAPGFVVIVHLDKKLMKEEYQESDLKKYMDNKDQCRYCGADIYVKRRYNVTWGKWSMMKPTLWAMHELTYNRRFKQKWDVFINLSADAMSVYTPKALTQFFLGPLKGINFLTSNKCLTGLVPTKRGDLNDLMPKKFFNAHIYNITYTEYDNKGVATRRDIKLALEPYHGSQWMALTAPFVNHVAMELSKRDSLAIRFKEALKYHKVWMTDETYLPTLINYHPVFNQTLPRMDDNDSLSTIESFFSIRYERMDEDKIHILFHKQNIPQRYVVPNSSSDIKKTRPWGPYYLGTYDLANIRDSGALFIRKVNVDLDPNIYKILPVNRREDIPYIQWPNELKISEKPQWDDFPWKDFIKSQIG